MPCSASLDRVKLVKLPLNVSGLITKAVVYPADAPFLPIARLGSDFCKEREISFSGPLPENEVNFSITDAIVTALEVLKSRSIDIVILFHQTIRKLDPILAEVLLNLRRIAAGRSIAARW